jgi:hypothetical protein
MRVHVVLQLGWVMVVMMLRMKLCGVMLVVLLRMELRGMMLVQVILGVVG